MVTQTVILYAVLGHIERSEPESAIREGLKLLKDDTTLARDVVETQLQLFLGDAYLMLGQIDNAEQALVRSAAETSVVWKSNLAARGLKARILLARGQAAEAARVADEAITLSRNAGIFEWLRFAATLLTRAEAHHAAGNIEAAKEAIREARDDLLARAEQIGDPTYRQYFLERLSVHTRTFSLAREWLGE